MRTLILIALITSSAIGQDVDTLQILRTVGLENQLDSLRQQFRTIDSELQTVKQRLAEGIDLSELLASLSGEDVDAPADQRSKRKRVDALLKAITARPGQLRFNGGATSIFQWNPRPAGRFTTATGSLNILAHTSLGGNSLLFFDFEAIGGNGPDQHVGALTPLNADGGSTQDNDGFDRLTVGEAWVEFSLLQEDLTLTAGKIDLTNYFDNNGVANDETSQFISAAFVNSAALPAPGSTPGIRVRSTLLSRIYLQFGLSSADNSGDNVLNELIKMGSVGFKVFPDDDYEANVRIYGYLHPSAENGNGYGLSFDQNMPAGLSIFARWNHNEPKLARWFGIAKAWSVGARLITSLSEDKLVFSAAYGETSPASATLMNELLFEFYMRYHLNKWVHVTTHVQYLRHAQGLPVDLSLIGIRTQFNF